MIAMHPRRGFTLIEVTVVSGLTVFLAVLLASAWAGVGRPAADLVSRGHIVQEMELAVATLSRDLGGSVANPKPEGDKKLGRWVGWDHPGDNRLRLCFDGGELNERPNWEVPDLDTVIEYRLEDNSLIRHDINADTIFTVAQNVHSLQVTPEGADDVRIVLSFTYRNLTLTCTLIAKQP